MLQRYRFRAKRNPVFFDLEAEYKPNLENFAIAIKILNMPLEIEKEEQYVLLYPRQANADESLAAEIRKAVINGLEAGSSNFILYLKEVKQVYSGFSYFLDELNQIIGKEEGLLVVAAAERSLAETLDEKEIVTTPTLDEASDYVFMEEIQKEFGDFDEDEEAEPDN
jgi:hypothetical protein